MEWSPFTGLGAESTRVDAAMHSTGTPKMVFATGGGLPRAWPWIRDADFKIETMPGYIVRSRSLRQSQILHAASTKNDRACYTAKPA
jgi:hypothetical protein